jgi:hypothetical protein
MASDYWFRERVSIALETIGANKRPWFRGHAFGKYSLLPSLQRQNNGRGIKYEPELYAEFVREAKDRTINNRPFPIDDHWAVLSLMRHYGMPTRFLDWTTSLDAALYFALCGRSEAPSVWALNPYRLNELATGTAVIFDDFDRVIINGEELDYYKSIAHRRKWPIELPIAMAPPFLNDRIRAQDGAFTIHGSNPQPLEEICGDAVVKITIPSEYKKALRRETLRKVDGGKLFPDLFGVAIGLRQRFRLER